MPVVVRTYAGRNAAEASAVFGAEAATLARDGYRATNQVWSDGGRSSAASLCLLIGVTGLVGGLLIWQPLLAVGIVAIIIGLLDRGTTGALAVTYQRDK